MFFLSHSYSSEDTHSNKNGRIGGLEPKSKTENDSHHVPLPHCRNMWERASNQTTRPRRCFKSNWNNITTGILRLLASPGREHNYYVYQLALSLAVLLLKGRTFNMVMLYVCFLGHALRGFLVFWVKMRRLISPKFEILKNHSLGLQMDLMTSTTTIFSERIRYKRLSLDTNSRETW